MTEFSFLGGVSFGEENGFRFSHFMKRRLNTLQQKQTQLILYLQYVLSKEKKAPKN